MTKPSTMRRFSARLIPHLLFAFALAATACSVTSNGNELAALARTTTSTFADTTTTRASVVADATPPPSANPTAAVVTDATTAPSTTTTAIAPSPTTTRLPTDPLDHPCWHHVQFRSDVCEIEGEVSCYDFDEGVWSACEYYDHAVEPCDDTTQGGWAYVFSDKWVSFSVDSKTHHHWVPTSAGLWEISYCFTNYRPGVDPESLPKSLLVTGTAPVLPCTGTYGVEILRDWARRHTPETIVSLDIPNACVGKEFSLQRLEHAEAVMRIRPSQRRERNRL